MKEKRKNNRNQTIVWPTTPYFTLTDLLDLNKDIKEITLRTKLYKLIDNKTLVEIGNITGEHGRPRKVYSLTPVTQNTLNKALQSNISLVDSAEKLVNVISVTPTIKSPMPAMAN